jgi:tRNA (adenine58-N1)-methyltransferase non-catalytic subunit
MDSENSAAEPTAGSSQEHTVDTRGVINLGQTVLFRLPRGDIKSAVLKQNLYETVYGFLHCRANCLRTVSLGKAGSFHASELIGDPYGLAYEIVDQKLHKLPPKTIQELGTCHGKIP